MSRVPQPTLNALVPEPQLISKQDMKCISLKKLNISAKDTYINAYLYVYKYII